MFSKMRFIMPLLFALALAAGIASLSTVQAAEKAEDEKPHCIVQAIENKNEKAAAKVELVEPTCFKTFSEAVGTATNGAVNLPEALDPSEVTQEMLKAPNAGNTVIGIEYNWKRYRGRTLTVYATNNVGCETGFSYSLPTMPRRWNDRVSSAEAFRDCAATHYEDTWFGGDDIECDSKCNTMGDSMNNRTSSIRWSP